MSLKINQSLLTHFVSGGFLLPIAQENVTYEPVLGAPYAAIKVFGNDVTPFNLSTSNETDGFFQCILYYPTGEGSVPSNTKADEILNHFSLGTTLVYDGQSLSITKASNQKGSDVDGWYTRLLRVYFVAIVPR